MEGLKQQSGRTSYKSVYGSVEEVEALLVRIYGPSLTLKDRGSPNFSFRTSSIRDDALLLCDCLTNDDLRSSFKSEGDDIIILMRTRGEFAVHTDDGDYTISRGGGFVFTMDHPNGYSSARATATTAIQIQRSAFDAALRQYSEDAPYAWSKLHGFSLTDGFGHLVQTLSARYRESFESKADNYYSEASLKLIRDAIFVAIAELANREAGLTFQEKFTASRRNVTRAVEMINSQTTPLTIHDLAAAQNISVRALQAGFRKHLSASPHNLLKTGRIEGARRDLLSGKATTVREAAVKWGFSNLARFAAEYHAATGESPKQTLLKWRDG